MIPSMSLKLLRFLDELENINNDRARRCTRLRNPLPNNYTELLTDFKNSLHVFRRDQTKIAFKRQYCGNLIEGGCILCLK